MALASLYLDFKGYYPDGTHRDEIPAQAGVYGVYECTHDRLGDKVSLQKLLYIGEAANVRDRIATHDLYEKWKSHVGRGNELCFTFAATTDRKRAEAGLIYEHKPPVNIEYRDCFPFDEAAFTLTGDAAAFLNRRFYLLRTDC